MKRQPEQHMNKIVPVRKASLAEMQRELCAIGGLLGEAMSRLNQIETRVASLVSGQQQLHMAGEEGFEPSLTDPESAVLPLDDSPARQNYTTEPSLEQWYPA